MRVHEPSMADRWLERARGDLRMADLAAEQKPPLLPEALFHCHQAAEKGLKSVIANSGAAPPRIHLLTVLLSQCLPQRPELEAQREDAELLEQYAVEPRYPIWPHDYSTDELAAALEAARRILSAVEASR